MAKFFLPGTYVSYGYLDPNKMISRDLYNDTIVNLNGYNQFNINSGDKMVDIPNTDMFIHGNIREDYMGFIKPDGSIEDIGATSVSTSYNTDACASADGSTVAWIAGDRMHVFDVATSTEIGTYTIAGGFNSSHPLLILNTDGTQALISAYGLKIKVVNTADGTELFASAANFYNGGGMYDQHNDKFIIKTTSSTIKVLNPTTWLFDADLTCPTVTDGYKWGTKSHPDGDVGYFLGNSIGTGDAYDFVNNAWIAGFTHLGFYNDIMWPSNDKMINIDYYNGDIWEYTWDGTSFGTAVRLEGVPHTNSRQHGCWLTADKWVVTGSIVDESDDDELIATAMTLDGVSRRGSCVIPAGTSDFSIPIPTDESVMVVISSNQVKKRHRVGEEYLLDDYIFAQDTDKRYKCTGAGTTAATKPAYPTSGSIVDGTATFTVDGVITQPITNCPVYPIPVPVNKIPLVTMNIHAGAGTYTPIPLLVGGTWTDPGATSIDDTDGDITALIVTGGDVVNTAVAGRYVVTYTSTNTLGAVGKASRVIVVT